MICFIITVVIVFGIIWNPRFENNKIFYIFFHLVIRWVIRQCLIYDHCSISAKIVIVAINPYLSLARLVFIAKNLRVVSSQPIESFLSIQIPERFQRIQKLSSGLNSSEVSFNANIFLQYKLKR